MGENSKKSTDFSMQSFWMACIASALMELAFTLRIIEIPSNEMQFFLNYLVGVVVFFGYWWYRASKVTSSPSFDGSAMFSIFFGSLVAQWGAVLIIIISGFFPMDSITVNSNDNDESIYYENCTDARYQGADPVYEDDPGYGSHLDRDGDGVGCE